MHEIDANPFGQFWTSPNWFGLYSPNCFGSDQQWLFTTEFCKTFWKNPNSFWTHTRTRNLKVACFVQQNFPLERIIAFPFNTYTISLYNIVFANIKIWFWKYFLLTFPACFCIPIIFYNMNYSCSSRNKLNKLSVTKKCSDLSLFD